MRPREIRLVPYSISGASDWFAAGLSAWVPTKIVSAESTIPMMIAIPDLKAGFTVVSSRLWCRAGSIASACSPGRH